MRNLTPQPIGRVPGPDAGRLIAGRAEGNRGRVSGRPVGARRYGWRASSELGRSHRPDRYTAIREQSQFLNLCARLGPGEV
jgi:hypothetical protein